MTLSFLLIGFDFLSSNLQLFVVALYSEQLFVSQAVCIQQGSSVQAAKQKDLCLST